MAEPNTTVKCRVQQEKGRIFIYFENQTLAPQIETSNLRTAFHNPTTLNAGSGLGLWLCKQLIVLHKGNITFSSKNHRFVVKITLG